MSPDIFEKTMNDLFGDLDHVLVHSDDMLILSNKEDAFTEHLNKAQTSLMLRLSILGMKVNLCKTEFCKRELDCLGCALAPSGIAKPRTKKVEVTLNVSYVLTIRSNSRPACFPKSSVAIHLTHR